MATAPTQEEIDAYNPPVNDGPPNHPYVSVYQYRKKLSEMGFWDKPVDIQKVADELGIPLPYALQLQYTSDKIKNNAQDALDAFKITRGTSKRTQPYYKGGKKSRRHAKKSRRHGKKSRRHGKKCRR
jgi:hypothetical protein